MLSASPEQRALLERWVRAANTPQSIALRARIILRSLDGATSKQIGQDLQVSQPTIRRWQRRFRDGGPEAITEIAPGRGRKPTYGARKVKRIIEATQNARPDSQTHWSCRAVPIRGRCVAPWTGWSAGWTPTAECLRRFATPPSSTSTSEAYARWPCPEP